MKTKTFRPRTIKIFAILALLVTFLLPESTFAQPPKWAPAHGYRAKTRHIYFPEQNFYYDVQKRNYIYLSGRSWVISSTIPRPFVGINLSRSSQIQLDYVGSKPYVYNATHKVKYKKIKVKSVPKKKVFVRSVPKRKVIVRSNSGNDNSHGNGNGKKK